MYILLKWIKLKHDISLTVSYNIQEYMWSTLETRKKIDPQ